jgi:hypothetical protein
LTIEQAQEVTTPEQLEREILKAEAIKFNPILIHFNYDHLPPHLQNVSRPICELALDYAIKLPVGPEKSVGLRKLLEAKDALVRAILPQNYVLNIIVPEPPVEVPEPIGENPS